MQIDIVLLFGVVASIVGSMFIALLCSLPGFVLDFFTELGGKKHYIFLALLTDSFLYSFRAPFYQLVQHPGERHGHCHGDDECRPVAQTVWFDVAKHKVDVYEICLEADCSDQCAEVVKPLWRAAEHSVEHQNGRDGERNVEHTLHKQGEVAVANLL